jgi:hypothetical protein
MITVKCRFIFSWDVYLIFILVLYMDSVEMTSVLLHHWLECHTMSGFIYIRGERRNTFLGCWFWIHNEKFAWCSFKVGYIFCTFLFIMFIILLKPWGIALTFISCLSLLDSKYSMPWFVCSEGKRWNDTYWGSCCFCVLFLSCVTALSNI